jgi:hypothetical protein|nr:MAG TPA: hypothetical protein [Bacteriophage sp.]
MNYSTINQNATPIMKFETLINLVGSILFGLLGMVAFFAALFYCAWWHVVTAIGSLVLSYTLFKDDEYGIESVQAYFKRIKSK